jgi:hypothetical protein
MEWRWREVTQTVDVVQEGKAAMHNNRPHKWLATSRTEHSIGRLQASAEVLMFQLTFSEGQSGGTPHGNSGDQTDDRKDDLNDVGSSHTLNVKINFIL